jgi:hypothetical protein
MHAHWQNNNDRLSSLSSLLSAVDLITFTSFRFFIQMIEGNPVPYATVYSVGNLLSLLSTTFLCGPKRQLKYVNTF